MIKLSVSALGFLFGLVSAFAPAAANAQDRVTLYSILKHRGEQRTFCMNFRLGTSGYSTKSCDLRYGSLYAGDDKDWLESSGAKGNRSVIKDLGLFNWDQAFHVPFVQPLPKLKPGEQRQITVDTSGADGADGAPGARGRDGVDGDGVLRPKEVPGAYVTPSEKPSRPKHDGKPRVDPMFVKAIAGHMYVIHVVDETNDFYVLFRVEEIEQGSSCTISWRLVAAPSSEAAQGKKPTWQ